MTDAAESRATISQVMTLVADLRTEIATLGQEQRQNFNALLDRLDTAVSSIREDFVPREVYLVQCQSTAQALDYAVRESRDDREDIWTAVHRIEVLSQRVIWWALTTSLMALGAIAWAVTTGSHLK